MQSVTYEIEYRSPDTGEILTETQEFEGTGEVTAEEWAEDYAYALSDKGWYEIRKVCLPKSLRHMS